jgi:hypothetical protein
MMPNVYHIKFQDESKDIDYEIPNVNNFLYKHGQRLHGFTSKKIEHALYFGIDEVLIIAELYTNQR